MNSTEKKELIEAIKTIQVSKKLNQKHYQYLLQAISNLKLEDKLIKEIK